MVGGGYRAVGPIRYVTFFELDIRCCITDGALYHCPNATTLLYRCPNYRLVLRYPFPPTVCCLPAAHPLGNWWDYSFLYGRTTTLLTPPIAVAGYNLVHLAMTSINIRW